MGSPISHMECLDPVQPLGPSPCPSQDLTSLIVLKLVLIQISFPVLVLILLVKVHV